jgi:LmbE family N-acetylglucosaminyl deacetylase
MRPMGTRCVANGRASAGGRKCNSSKNRLEGQNNLAHDVQHHRLASNQNMHTAANLPTNHHCAQGTDELAWQSALAAVPLWSPPDGPLLIVSPHPDNEVMAAGGLIYVWKQWGRKVTILSLTDGEAAYPQWKRLGRIRREELKDALQVLAESPASVVRLGIPDGRVAEYTGKVRGAIMSLATSNTTIISPFEEDGHPDHDAAGRICCEMAQAHGLSVARYPIWTWHHADPSTVNRAAWRRFPLSDRAQAAKADALRCFPSQLAPYKRTPVVPEHLVRYFARPYETFFL